MSIKYIMWLSFEMLLPDKRKNNDLEATLR